MDYRSRAVRYLLGATAHPGGLKLTTHLIARMQLPAAAVIADVACGAGATLEVLQQGGHHVIGVDLHTAARRSVRGDAHNLPLASAAYDGVVCECALSTFDRPGEALLEMRRVLRPGGVVGLTDVVLDRERAGPVVSAAVDRLTSARTVAAYADLVTDAGLTVVRTEDRAQDATALVRRLRRRLPLSRTLRACEEAVRSGSLGYALLVARVS